MELVIKSVCAGSEGPQADILARFVRETWCSEEHTLLNNVTALKTNNHIYVRLRERGGKREIEPLVGKEAPGQLVTIARKLLRQLVVDACDGYDPCNYVPPYYDEIHPTREGAEEEWAKYRTGTVCRYSLFAPGHEGFICNRSYGNAPPDTPPALLKEADQAGMAERTLDRKRADKRRIEKVVAFDLQHLDDKKQRHSRLKHAKHTA